MDTYKTPSSFIHYSIEDEKQLVLMNFHFNEAENQVPNQAEIVILRLRKSV